MILGFKTGRIAPSKMLPKGVSLRHLEMLLSHPASYGGKGELRWRFLPWRSNPNGTISDPFMIDTITLTESGKR